MFRTLAVAVIAPVIIATLVLPNASFDGPNQQCTPWASYNGGLPSGGTIHVVTAEHFSGPCSTLFTATGEVLQTTEAGGIESVNIAVKPGHTYQIGMMVKGSMTDNSFIKFGPVFHTSGGDHWAYQSYDHLAASEWTKMTITRLAPLNTSTMTVRIYNYNTGDTWIALFVDNVTVTEVASAND